MNFLLGILHPRRLSYFLDSLRVLDYVDVFLAKNMEIVQAATTIRDFFLKLDYDYLILTSDDVVIPYLGPLMLMKDVQRRRFDILTGWSRRTPNSLHGNISPKPAPHIELKKGKALSTDEYHFYTVNNLVRLFSQGNRFIPVWFVGYSLTAMSRKVVEAWTPSGWNFCHTSIFNPVTLPNGRSGFWQSTDLHFSYQMWKLGFQKHADLAVYVPHYSDLRNLLVGKMKPEVEFIKAKKSPRKVKMKPDLMPVLPDRVSKYPSKAELKSKNTRVF